MPIPSKERVSELVGPLIDARGFDLEDVEINSAGRHSTVRLVVDGDTAVGLDDVAAISRDVSEAFDAATEFGETPYNLEVTTPGIDRPLTTERHWRRAQGRKVKLQTATGPLTGRVGAVAEGSVDLVVPGKQGPSVTPVVLADVTEAVVQIEFSPPDARELELTGGVAAGRPRPGDDDDTAEGTDK